MGLPGIGAVAYSPDGANQFVRISHPQDKMVRSDGIVLKVAAHSPCEVGDADEG